MARPSPVSLHAVMAYRVTWMLLMSGFRMAIQHGTGAVDASILTPSRPALTLLRAGGTVGAVYVGWRLLAG